MARYIFNPIRFEGLTTDESELFECDKFICKFTRNNVREVLESCYSSPQQVGSVIRLLNQKYPLKCRTFSYLKQEILQSLGAGHLVEYLRFKGFRVFQTPRGLSDDDIVNFVEQYGFDVVGSLNGRYYNTQNKGGDKQVFELGSNVVRFPVAK